MTEPQYPGGTRKRALSYGAWVALLAAVSAVVVSTLAPLWVAAGVGLMVAVVTGTMAERFVRHPLEDNAPIIRRRVVLIWLLGSGLFLVAFAIAAFTRGT